MFYLNWIKMFRVSSSVFVALGAAIIFGGVIAPVLLMIGLVITTDALASLLLNLEASFYCCACLGSF